MATYTSLDLAEAKRIGRLYGVEVVSSEGLSAGSVNSNYALVDPSGRKVFLRIYEEQARDGAEADVQLLDFLATRGIPTPKPIARVSGGFVAEHAGKPVALFPWIEGTIRCTKAVSERDMRAVGDALAKIHLAGAPKPRPSRFSTAKLRDRCDVIQTASDPSLSSMADVLRRELDTVESERKSDAPRGLVHGDLFRDNVLWQGDRLAAVLDFESAADGPFAFDLAVTMLAWTYDDDFRWPLAHAMFDGYRAVRPLAPGDADAFFAEAKMGCLRFATTRITDYAMRAHLGANVPRDWKRFWKRYEAIRALGDAGLRRAVGLAG